MKSTTLGLTGIFVSVALAVYATPRVALMDFSTDDNSYRNRQAASDFSVALQAGMSAEPGMAWVERNQWQSAARELKLAAADSGDVASALQLGKWVKADLLVVGRFQADQKQGRELEMEVIDPEHADVLVERKVSMSSRANQPLQTGMDMVSASARVLTDALREAEARQEQIRAQHTVAPLFFGNVGHLPRLDFFESDLMDAFQKTSSTATNVHVLRLPRAREATEESELIIGGFVEADLGAWQHVADVYVWGSFAEREAANLPFEQIPVDVTWYVWNGRTEPQQFARTVTVAELPQLANEVAKTAITVVQQPARSDAEGIEIRSRVANLLSSRAGEFTQRFDKTPSLYATPQGHDWWQYQVNTLNAARFFEPQDRRIQKQAVLQYWAPLWATPASPWFRTDLWAHERCASDFAGYVNKFGLDGLDGNGRFDPRFTRLYIQGLYGTLVELKRAEEESQMLADWPSDVRAEWHERMDQDFLDRVKLADSAFSQIDSKEPHWKDMNLTVEWESQFYPTVWQSVMTTVRDPAVRVAIFEDVWATAPDWLADEDNTDSLKRTYAEIDQPDRGQAMVDKLLNLARKRRAAQSALVQPAKVESLYITLPPIKVLPPPLAPSSRRVELPGNDDPQGVASLCWAGGKLWVSAQSIDSNAHSKDMFSTPAGTGLPVQLFPLLIEPARTRLVEYDPSTKATTDVEEQIGLHSKVTAMTCHENKLWLASQGDGIWYLDPETLQARHFGSREGVPSEELYANAFVPPHLFVGGGRPANGTLGIFNPQTMQWMEEKPAAPIHQVTALAGCGQYLLVGAQNYDGSPAQVRDPQILLFNMQAHSWTNLTQALFAGSPWQLSEGRDLMVSTADDNGFWLGSSSGLIFVNPENGTVRKWFPRIGVFKGYPVEPRKPGHQFIMARDGMRPTTRLRGSVTAMVHDGDFLWVATTTTWGTYVSHKRGDPSNFFSPIEDENYIFLFHKPSGRWVGQFQVNSRVTALAVSDGQLWIGFDRGERVKALLEVDKRPLLQIPQNSWVSDDVPEAELGKRVAELDVLEQASYYFLTGDDQKVLNLLKDLPAGSDNAEAQKLMVMSSEETSAGKSPASAVGPAKVSINPAKDLREAIRQGNLEQVAAILPAVKDPYALGEALCVAAAWGKTEAADLLLAQGVSVNFQKNNNGQPGVTPLISAAADGRTETVRELIARGARLEMRNDIGNTALHVAACYGNAKTVGLLLEKGAAINARNSGDWTPLMFAAQCGSVATANVLLSQGAQQDTVNAGGYNALGIAEDHHCLKMIAFLKQMGAKAVPENTANE